MIQTCELCLSKASLSDVFNNSGLKNKIIELKLLQVLNQEMKSSLESKFTNNQQYKSNKNVNDNCSAQAQKDNFHGKVCILDLLNFALPSPTHIEI